MPINPTYPGVYVEELTSSVHAIVGVSTSVTAFIGRAVTGVRDKAVTIHSFEEYARIFGGLSENSSMSYAVYQYFLNGGQDAIIVAVDDGATPANFERILTSIEDDAKKAPSASNKLKFQSLYPGILSNNISIYVQKNSVNKHVNIYIKGRYDSGAYPELSKEADKVKAWLNRASTWESYFNLSLIDTDTRSLSRVLENSSNNIKLSSNTITDLDTDLTKSLGLYSPSGGTDGSPAKTLTDEWKRIIPSASIPPSKIKKGIYALDDVGIFNILCIPPLQKVEGGNKVELDIDATEVYSRALKYCKDKRAILLIDPPSEWTDKSSPTDTSTGIDVKFSSLRTNGANAAIFFPRIRAPDPNDENRFRAFVPCGFVAGVIARTDSERGVWKAPAGIQAGITGANDLAVRLTDLENGELNPIGINCLRIKSPGGIVVWGSRTMRGADELTDPWKYLPVRRLALFIEESLYRGTQWVIFEPNDERLWSQIRLNVGSFMQDLFTKGAFQGSTPKEAYLVKCDHETTTQSDIDRGIVNIVIGFAPLKPAEFVILNIEQLAGQTVEART